MVTWVVATVFFVFYLVKIGEENEGKISRRRESTIPTRVRVITTSKYRELYLGSG